MQAVILAGGKSQGLAPINELRPKVLIPLLNKPLLERTIESLPEIIDEVFITCNYRAEDIEKFLNTKKYPQKIKIIKEDRKNLGSAGAVKNLEDELKDDYLIISGDVVSSIDFKELINFHKEKNANITVSVFSVSNPLDYGIIGMNPNNEITKFTEKPKADLVFSKLTNAGIYVANTKMMNYIPRLSYYDFAVDLLPYLLKKDFQIYGFQFYGYWMDLGRAKRLLEAHKALLQRTMEFKYEGGTKEDLRLLPPMVIGKQCKLQGTLGPEVCIGDRVKIKDSKISGSVIYDDVRIGSNSLVKDSIICPGCQIGDRCIIEGAVLADGCKVANGAKIGRNARIWPAQQVKRDIAEGKNLGKPEE